MTAASPGRPHQPPALGERLRLRSGVDAVTDAEDRTHLVLWPHSQTLGRLTPEERATLRRLAVRSHDRDASTHDGPAPAAARTHSDATDSLVARLRTGGWLEVTVTDGTTSLYTLEPLRPAVAAGHTAVPARPALSRFSSVAGDGTHMVLDSPRARYRVRVHNPRVLAMIGVLGTDDGDGRPARDDLDTVGFGRRVTARLLDDLAAAGHLTDPDAAHGSDDEPRLAQWSPHELWFHARSRLGFRERPGVDFGATWRADGSWRPPPLRDSFPGAAVELPRPDMDALRSADPPFTEVLETRRSVREFDDDTPLSRDALAEFLYRCAGARSRLAADGAAPARPYPSGGACYELEFYPVVHRVEGLTPGLYRYDAAGHRLEPVQADHADVRRLTGVATTLQGMSSPPQVLIIISARFGRVMGKYQAMAYALILKHVGVVQQVMYLVATAMGLAACAIGTGEAERFSDAIGTDYLTESAVGEFILGTRPALSGATP